MLIPPCFKDLHLRSRPFLPLLAALLAAVVLAAGMTASAAAPPDIKVAVLDFEQRGDAAQSMPDLGLLVADWLITGLVADGRYQVIERRYLQKLLKEQKFQASGLADGHNNAGIGKLLGVQVLVTGTIARLGDGFEATIRVVEVETAAILSSHSAHAATTTALRNKLQEMAAYLIEGKQLTPKWSTYSAKPAASSVAMDKTGTAVWDYTVPEINDDIYAGLEGQNESVSLSDRSLYITLHTEKGWPLYLVLLSWVEGYSRPGEPDTLVPGEVFLELSPGKQELVITPGDLAVPQWWRDDHNNTEVRFFPGDIRMVEFACEIDEETGPVADRVQVLGIVVR